MHYCIRCEKVTKDMKINFSSSDFSSIFQVIVISCEECGTFKFQYLEEDGENEIS